MSDRPYPEVGGHASTDATVHDLPPLPAALVQPAAERPARCPCGHPICDDYRCISGWVYGPCPHELCGGVCESIGQCTSENCACKEDE